MVQTQTFRSVAVTLRVPVRVLHRKSLKATRSITCMAKSDPSQLWALDFDGVVCDSCGESAISAWKAASKLWPDVFSAPSAVQQYDELIEKMRAVRPVVETGYENIVQIRCLLEGVQVQDMLDNWHSLLPQHMEKWQLDRAELVDLFGSTRDEWMAEDLNAWLAPNRIYSGTADAVKKLMKDQEAYIVTTKQARFTKTILEQMAGIEFPMERIFSQTVSGRPKSEVLQDLQSKHPEASCHFVEDKLSTLEKVAKLDDLSHWNLYLVDWGYNTAAERERAQRNKRITVIDIDEFKQLTSV